MLHCPRVPHLRPVGHPPTTAARTLPDQPRQDGSPGRADRPRQARAPEAQGAIVAAPRGRFSSGRAENGNCCRNCGSFYPRTFDLLLRALRRLGRGVLRSRGARVARRPRRDGSLTSTPTSSGVTRRLRLHCPNVVRHLRRLSAAYAAAGEAHYYEVRDGHSTRLARRLRLGARATSADTHGRLLPAARGDADLPESHGLQRAVPVERARRVQRAGRAIHEPADLRRADTARGGRRPGGGVGATSVSSRSNACSTTRAVGTSSTSTRRTRR